MSNPSIESTQSRETAAVLIIGAGAAGLAAAREISASGVRVTVLEARDRIGGRIYTYRDDKSAVPVELGAEFVHGKPRESLEIIEAARLMLCDATDHHWYLREGILTPSDEFWSQVEEIMGQMKRSGGRDRSFQEFLDEYGLDSELQEAKSMAAQYVQGFHAARTERIGVQGLSKVNEAADQIEGDKQFRVLNGYDRIAQWLYDEAVARSVDFKFETIVEEVRWSRNHVDLAARSASGPQHFEASRAVVTLPLGVLQAPPMAIGAVRFIPAVPEKERAAITLAMGQVVKITFLFRERFWERLKLPTRNGDEDLSQLGFIHAPDESIPTWWTQLPVRVPVLVGWVGGPWAERQAQSDERLLFDRALDSLQRILRVPRKRIEDLLEASYTHNWQADPFTRGAYSYVPVGGLDAQAELARPVENTLFFAGEATNTEGHSGTVHGALASGEHAARQVIRGLQFD